MEPTQALDTLTPMPPASPFAPSLAHTPPPQRQLKHPSAPPLGADPEPTAHAGGQGAAALPHPGDIVQGFRIVEKLGQGGFGSVFLGEQVALADRKVALKFTARCTAEPELLASLQHANVVPVYSVHSHPPLQVLCMPYLGRHTLADAVAAIARTKSLPATGAGLLSTVARAKDDTRKSKGRSKGRRGAVPADPTPADAAPVETPQPIREMLATLSFPESVVWLMARLADGLAHAHDRGIIHLDLKPANVLITDDGTPMILDFGLAHDRRDARYAVTGGTVRYMSPEQLAGFSRPDGFQPDRRMDLYALGVMFFELLTGRHPFEETTAVGTSMLTVLAARRTVAPRATAFNAAVSPAVAAVVAKLLHPTPAQRYQSAHDLLADLTRHRESRPLQFAGNPSLRERLVKFRRRHPVGAVTAAAAFFAVFAALATGAALSANRERAALAATAGADELTRAADQLRLDLPSGERKKEAAGLKTADEFFGRFKVERERGWANGPALAPLPEPARLAARRTLGELAVLSAHAEEASAIGKAGDERAAALRRAAEWNRRARACFDGMPVPPAVTEQAERLAAKVGDPAPPPPAEVAAVSAFDHYVRGVALLAEGRYAAAAEPLEALADAEPGHAAGQYALGQAYQAQGRFAAALERMQLAKALAPADPRPAFQRGVMLLSQNRAAEARKEFDTALDRDPTSAAAHFHRALARGPLGDTAGAVADLTKAMDLGESPLRCLILRARLHDRRAEADKARADRARADELTPADEQDFLARGVGKVGTDPATALADFEKASELNPRYLPAFMNQAHVLSERLPEKQLAKAADVLTAVIELAPGYAPAVAGRGVIRARLGQWADARADAAKAVELSADPTVRMQVASVYALTAKDDQADLKLALQHFRRAIRDGYPDVAGTATDPDLALLRETEGYRKLIDAVQQLKPQ